MLRGGKWCRFWAISIVGCSYFYVFLFSYFIGQILPRTILTMEYVVKNVMFFQAASPSCYCDQCFSFFHRKNQFKTNQKPHKT